MFDKTVFHQGISLKPRKKKRLLGQIKDILMVTKFELDATATPFERLKNFLMKIKFELGRGIQYTQLLFWAFTISNVVMLNVKSYFQISIYLYALIVVVASILIIFGVWFLGWIDVVLGFYSSERYYASILDPVVKDILDTTKNSQKRIPKS